MFLIFAYFCKELSDVINCKEIELMQNKSLCHSRCIKHQSLNQSNFDRPLTMNRTYVSFIICLFCISLSLSSREFKRIQVSDFTPISSVPAKSAVNIDQSFGDIIFELYFLVILQPVLFRQGRMLQLLISERNLPSWIFPFP